MSFGVEASCRGSAWVRLESRADGSHFNGLNQKYGAVPVTREDQHWASGPTGVAKLVRFRLPFFKVETCNESLQCLRRCHLLAAAIQPLQRKQINQSAVYHSRIVIAPPFTTMDDQITAGSAMFKGQSFPGVDTSAKRTLTCPYLLQRKLLICWHATFPTPIGSAERSARSDSTTNSPAKRSGFKSNYKVECGPHQ
ncbi:hypothetical protein B0H13DRAFT_1863161 [Mycena leptocephala]|nr:hypothetical protein B0H13DRAFT_1863161 [Mycena leptocephala]